MITTELFLGLGLLFGVALFLIGRAMLKLRRQRRAEEAAVRAREEEARRERQRAWLSQQSSTRAPDVGPRAWAAPTVTRKRPVVDDDVLVPMTFPPASNYQASESRCELPTFTGGGGGFGGAGANGSWDSGASSSSSDSSSCSSSDSSSSSSSDGGSCGSTD